MKKTWMFLFLASTIHVGGCDDAQDPRECTTIQGREVNLDLECTVGIIQLACVEVKQTFALTGHECRVSRDGRVFVDVTAPASFTMADFVPCPAELGVKTIGAYTDPCPPGTGK
jgi:hypothetical protein